MVRIQKEERGVLLYMCQEGRGMESSNKIHVDNFQESEGLDTVEMNEPLGFSPNLREFCIGPQILADLGCGEVRLLSFRRLHCQTIQIESKLSTAKSCVPGLLSSVGASQD